VFRRNTLKIKIITPSLTYGRERKSCEILYSRRTRDTFRKRKETGRVNIYFDECLLCVCVCVRTQCFRVYLTRTQGDEYVRAEKLGMNVFICVGTRTKLFRTLNDRTWDTVVRARVGKRFSTDKPELVTRGINVHG